MARLNRNRLIAVVGLAVLGGGLLYAIASHHRAAGPHSSIPLRPLAEQGVGGAPKASGPRPITAPGTRQQVAALPAAAPTVGNSVSPGVAPSTTPNVTPNAGSPPASPSLTGGQGDAPAGVSKPVITVSPVQSAAVAPVTGMATAGDMFSRDEEADLRHELRIWTLKAQIADKKRDADKGGTQTSPATASPITVAPQPMTPAPSTDGAPTSTTISSLSVGNVAMPPPPKAQAKVSDAGLVLVSTMIDGGHSLAVIAENGTSFPVAVGATLSNGWHVTSIGAASIDISNGRSHRTIQVGG
jgi:hypothetical protein